MDSYKKRILYAWLVPLLCLTSLISFVVWYIIIGHESFFGFFPNPAKVSFGQEMLYGGLALMYLIPVFLLTSWFGEGIVNAFKKLFKKKKEYEEPSNFDLLETGLYKFMVLLTLVVGLYALPVLVSLYVIISIIFFRTPESSDSIPISSSNNNTSSDSSIYSSGELISSNTSNADLEKAYQYTSGILKEIKDRKLEVSNYQKNILRDATAYLNSYSEKPEIDRAVDVIEKVANELYVDKDLYYKDRGEIYISPYQGSEYNNKAEFVYGIKKDIKRIAKK